MKLIRILGLVAGAALSLLAFAATASATTLEVKGVKQTGAVTVKASLKAGTSLLLADTSGSTVNTCTGSAFEGTTTIFTGTTVTVPLKSMTFETCAEPPVVVDAAGSLTIERIGTTTNGTVRWPGAKWTWPSPFGTIACSTATSPGTDVGTLTGVATGQATLDVNAVISCGSFFPSVKWSATYVITTPEGLGVTA